VDAYGYDYFVRFAKLETWVNLFIGFSVPQSGECYNILEVVNVKEKYIVHVLFLL